MPTVARTTNAPSEEGGGGAVAWPPGRVGLLVAGIVLVICYIVLLFLRTTSTVTEKDAADKVTKITDTSSIYPEATTSVVIGAAILLLVAASFYNRITKITGPGGIAIEFSDNEKRQASDAVSNEVKSQDSPLKTKAVSDDSMSESDADNEAKTLAVRASNGTLDVLQDARYLLKLASSSRAQALDTAVQDWSVPQEAAESLIMNGQTSQDLWTSLAQRALRG